MSTPAIPDEVFGTGYIPRDYSAQPMGSIPFTAPFDRPLIPRDEWVDRIKEQEANESDALSVFFRAGGVCDYQNGFSFCWMHGALNDLMCELARQGYGQPGGPPLPKLSPTACALKIKNGRNVGGNTFDGIPFLAKHGAPLASLWPVNSRTPTAGVAEVWDSAKAYRATKYAELEPNNVDQMMTELLCGGSVTVGYMWWGHMVVAARAQYRMTRGRIEYGVRGINSHGNKGGPFGDGTYEAWGDKMRAFDQCSIREVTTPEAIAA
jgi:hypothetical protein